MAKEKLEIEITAQDKASKTLGGLTKALGTFGKLAGGVAIAGIGAAAAVTTGAMYGLGKGISYALDEAMEAQEINAQLEAVLASTGGAAGLTAEEVNKIAESFSEVTRFEDDAIVAGQTTLLQFTKIGEDIFPRATEAVLDFAQRTGRDLPEAALIVGRALEGEIGRLGLYGITFTDAEKKAIDSMMETGQVAEAQAIIFGRLDEKFGGAARAAGETLPGKLDILRNTLSNTAEDVGDVLIPVITQALTDLSPIIMELANKLAALVSSDQFKQWLSDTATFIVSQLIPAITNFTNWIMTSLVPALQRTYETFNTQILPVLQQFWSFVQENIIPVLRTIGDILGVVLPPLITAFVGGWKLVLDIIAKVKSSVEFFIDAWKRLGDTISKINLPDWLTPGSPTPLELGLRGINDAMSQLNRAALPSFQAQMAGGGIAGGGGMGGGGSVVINYSPGISLGSRAEFESMVVPLIDNAMRSVRRGTI